MQLYTGRLLDEDGELLDDDALNIVNFGEAWGTHTTIPTTEVIQKLRPKMTAFLSPGFPIHKLKELPFDGVAAAIIPECLPGTSKHTIRFLEVEWRCERLSAAQCSRLAQCFSSINSLESFKFTYHAMQILDIERYHPQGTYSFFTDFFSHLPNRLETLKIHMPYIGFKPEFYCSYLLPALATTKSQLRHLDFGQCEFQEEHDHQWIPCLIRMIRNQARLETLSMRQIPGMFPADLDYQDPTLREMIDAFGNHACLTRLSIQMSSLGVASIYAALKIASLSNTLTGLLVGGSHLHQGYIVSHASEWTKLFAKCKRLTEFSGLVTVMFENPDPNSHGPNEVYNQETAQALVPHLLENYSIVKLPDLFPRHETPGVNIRGWVHRNRVLRWVKLGEFPEYGKYKQSQRLAVLANGLSQYGPVVLFAFVKRLVTSGQFESDIIVSVLGNCKRKRFLPIRECKSKRVG